MFTFLFLILILGILINSLLSGFNTLNIIYLVLSAILLIMHIPKLYSKIFVTKKRSKFITPSTIIYGSFFVLILFSGFLFSPLKDENKYYNNLSQASRLIESEKYIKAETLLQELHSKDRGDVNVLLQLGILYLRQDRIDDSWTYLLQAYQIMPYDLDILYNMAINRYQLSKSKDSTNLKLEALKHLDAILKISPNVTKVHLYAGQVSMDLQNYKKALYHFESARKLDPENPVIYYNLANRSIDLMEYAVAKTHIEKGISLKPDKTLESELKKLLDEIADKTKGGV